MIALPTHTLQQRRRLARGLAGYTFATTQIVKAVFFLLLVLSLGACSPTRRLAAGEKLYTGAKVEFRQPTAITQKNKVEADLFELIRPYKNNPIKLWIFNLFAEPKKKKGFKYWLKYKMGEPPSVYDEGLIARSRLIAEKYLHDEGYLNAQVQTDTIDQVEKVKVVYAIQAEKKYWIKEVVFPNGNSPLERLTQQNKQYSLLKPGQVYQAENLRAERTRLATLATQNGYFGVTQNDLYFYVDTTQCRDSLDIYVQWKNLKDSTGVRQYRLGETTVYPTYSLTDPEDLQTDSLLYQGLTIREKHFFVKEQLLRRAVRGKEGDLYDGREQNNTINYLQNLDLFKFINLRTEKREQDGQHYVDRTFYLTPSQVRDLRFDFEANTRSGSYFGILTALNFTHRNWLKGAEQLAFNLSVGGETQMGNIDRFINTLEITAGVSLSLPRLWLPIRTYQAYKSYVPRTLLNLSNAFQIRAGFFSTNRLTASVSYDWKYSARFQHRWTPLSFSQNRTLSIDPDFQTQLNENRRLANSLEDILILGGEYRWTYTTQEINALKPYFYLSNTIELAGNIPYAIGQLLKPRDAPYSIFRSRFSQFFKFNLDARYHYPYKSSSWAFRLAGGMISSYGNTTIAPYSKQFFIGGSTSLRAFRLRQLGPGSYVNPDLDQLDFFDQTGDIKLEFNAEYRFDLISYLEGAFFVDAGNIWLRNDTVDNSNQGRFRFNTFLQEIAVGVGGGLRVDFQYFLIRLDAAFPVRQAIIDEGFQWTFNQIQLFQKDWRADHLIWHLAIGYPF